MKKITEKIAVMMMILLFLLCLTEPEIAGKAVYGAVQRCLETVIPSLYAVMVLSVIIIRSGITSCVQGLMNRIAERIFGMEGFVLPIFMFSMFAGYPVGTKMLVSEYDSGRLTKKRAELLCGLCYGAGPAFIFGCISGKLYGSRRIGELILISTVSANLILALFMSFFLRKSVNKRGESRSFRLSPDMLTECVISGGRSVIEICFMITAFAVLSAFIRASGAAGFTGGIAAKITDIPKETAASLFCAFLDVTDISGLPCGDHTVLPYICGLVSFGGSCVIFQTAAAISGRFSVIPLVLERLAAAVISVIICRLLMPYYFLYETALVSSVQIHPYNGYSPIPSVMLMIMTALLFYKCGENNKKCE